MAISMRETAELRLGEVDYHFTCSVVSGGEVLIVDVEQKSNNQRWRGEFPSASVEDMTAKAGNFKSFPVFVKMLLAGLKKTTDTVYLDIATYSELEALNHNNNQKVRGAANSINNVIRNNRNNKRYLMLTYVVEFDKVTYPLALLPSSTSDLRTMKSTISRQREEIDELRMSRSSVHEVKSLKEENAALREQMRRYERERNGGRRDHHTSDYKDVVVDKYREENDQLRRERLEFESKYEMQRQDLRELMQELRELRESEKALKVRLNEKSHECEMLQKRLALNARSKAAGRILSSPYRPTAVPQTPPRARSRSPSPSASSRLRADPLGLTPRSAGRAGSRYANATSGLTPRQTAKSAGSRRSATPPRGPRRAAAGSMTPPRLRSRSPSPLPSLPTSLGRSPRMRSPGHKAQSARSPSPRPLTAGSAPIGRSPQRGGGGGEGQFGIFSANEELSDIDKRLDAITSFLSKRRGKAI
eukprot:gnl/Hemi2/18815_TR6227_c0_g1_i1.p1 gnl/Hemi2/18815_TR6227_c0_g1~~gnl/Hemi2/18815_TR6227_c0_g1_i1.p1  ORF type:complete len:474 (+),score=139.16 gnl/Hemi2/18815_TR6227_c0_g1_i1:143-1564(+)